jgi:hypothetical protein
MTRSPAMNCARVLGAHFGVGPALGLCHEHAERLVGRRTVCQQRQLVGRMETHQVTHAPSRVEQRAQPRVREDALDEVLAQPRVREAALLLYREVGPGGQQRFGEDPPALALAHAPAAAVDLHPLEPAAWRVALEDEAIQVLGGQRLRLSCRPAGHLVGPVAAGTRDDEAHQDAVDERAPLRRVLQPHCLARHRQARLDLRTGRHPGNLRAEDVHQVGVALVPAVPPHLVAQQAAGDSNAHHDVIMPPRRPWSRHGDGCGRDRLLQDV